MFTVYGEKYKESDPILDSKTNEIIDDGKPRRVRLGQWSDKAIAESMAENIKNSVAKRSWKIWVE